MARPRALPDKVRFKLAELIVKRERLAKQYRECMTRQRAAMDAAGYPESETYTREYTDEDWKAMEAVCDPIQKEYPRGLCESVFAAEDEVLLVAETDLILQARTAPERDAVTLVFKAAVQRRSLTCRWKALELVYELFGKQFEKV